MEADPGPARIALRQVYAILSQKLNCFIISKRRFPTVATSSDAVDPSSKGGSAGRACKPITDREGTLGRFRFVIWARPVADRKTHRSEGGGSRGLPFFSAHAALHKISKR